MEPEQEFWDGLCIACGLRKIAMNGLQQQVCLFVCLVCLFVVSSSCLFIVILANVVAGKKVAWSMGRMAIWGKKKKRKHNEIALNS